MNREEFLECMAWCGTGVVYGLTGAGMVGRALADDAGATMPAADRTFVQISGEEEAFVRRDSMPLKGEGLIGLGRIPDRDSPLTIHFVCEDS